MITMLIDPYRFTYTFQQTGVEVQDEIADLKEQSFQIHDNDRSKASHG